MVMSAMRENTKWIMLILTVAFVGWLVFDWVQSRQTGGGAGTNPVVGIVAGREIHYAEWSRFLDQQLQQVRDQARGVLTDEERYQAEERAWQQLVDRILIQEEVERLGIRITDEEIRQAFLTSPPPQLRSEPAFQTSGRFDMQKYRQYFSSQGVPEQLLMQLESYYRETLPRSKLFLRVSQGVAVTSGEVWQAFLDRRQTATARFVSLSPEQEVGDDEVEVAEGAVRDYYRGHRDEFRQPPTATVTVVSLSASPSAEDTAGARARADSLRDVITSGDRTFESVAEEYGAAGQGQTGGLVGEVTRDGLAPELAEEVFALSPGEVSEPVLTPAGFQLLRVDERRGDTATVGHVVVPVTLSPAAEDRIFGRMDRLESVALRESLRAAADSLGLPVRTEVALTPDSRFVPGAGALEVAVAWAHSPNTLPGDLSQFFENASGFHVLQLVSRSPGRTFPLEEVRPQIRQRLASRQKVERLRQRMTAFADSVRAGADFTVAAGRRAWEVRTAEAFTRFDPVSGLGQATEATGAAFGLAPGGTSHVADAGGRLAVLQLVERTDPDPAAFAAARQQLRNQLTAQRQQAWVDAWISALREEAEVQDLREQRLAAARQAAP